MKGEAEEFSNRLLISSLRRRLKSNPAATVTANGHPLPLRWVVMFLWCVVATAAERPWLPPSDPLKVVEPWREVNGTRIPAMLYGTAYKRHSTADLVERALRAGFLGVDTATAEGKRYNDSGVGEALVRVFSATPRSEYYVQLKVHHVRAGTKEGGEPGEAAERVVRSLDRGLANLNLDHVDTLLLRGPSAEAVSSGLLSQDDKDAWDAMGDAVRAGKAKRRGVCNFKPVMIDQLREMGGPPVTVLQVRALAPSGYARQIREYCARHSIIFQAPSLITTNRAALERGGAAHRVAYKHRVTTEQTLLRFALQIGIVPVVGPSSARHIKDDIDAFKLDLEPTELAVIEKYAGAASDKPANQAAAISAKVAAALESSAYPDEQVASKLRRMRKSGRLDVADAAPASRDEGGWRR